MTAKSHLKFLKSELEDSLRMPLIKCIKILRLSGQKFELLSKNFIK